MQPLSLEDRLKQLKEASKADKVCPLHPLVLTHAGLLVMLT